MNSTSSPEEPFRAIIAGGGVAALKAGLALREFGGDRIATTILAPNPEFVYRPMTVREPFGYAAAKRYPLEAIAQEIGVELVADSFKWLDGDSRVVHTEAGKELSYDALLLALGARLYPRFKHVITIDDKQLDELLHGLMQDIEGGYTHRLAFIIPSGKTWPLPIYELALMTASRAYDMNVDLSITIATPEDAPLAIFGLGVSDAVRQLLEKNGIVTITSAHREVPEPGHVAIIPGSRHLRADRIVALTHHGRAWVELRDQRHANVAAGDQDRGQVPRALPGGTPGSCDAYAMTMLGGTFNLNHPAQTVHWQFFTMTVSNGPTRRSVSAHRWPASPPATITIPSPPSDVLCDESLVHMASSFAATSKERVG